MKDVFWSLFGMVAEGAARGWHFSSHPCQLLTLWGKKVGLMRLLLIVQQAIDPTSIIPPSLLPAFSL